MLERETGLSDIIETGTLINAEVNADLLCTLFYPGSPLHDGAVVIRRDRVIAAGCTLPLSESREVQGMQVHTRHKAALGISEQSDALVVVVSEETGIISLAFDGKMARGLRDDGRLRDLLIREYTGRERPSRPPPPGLHPAPRRRAERESPPPKTPRRRAGAGPPAGSRRAGTGQLQRKAALLGYTMLAFLQRSVRHNFGYKLLCLFFAVVLHFYAAGLINARPPHILILPLTVRNLPPNLILDDKSLPSVTLTLDGPPDEISRLTDTTVDGLGGPLPCAAGQTPPLTVHLSGLPADVTVESDPRPVALLLAAAPPPPASHQRRRHRHRARRLTPSPRLSSRRARPSSPGRARPSAPSPVWSRRRTRTRRPGRWTTTSPSSPWMRRAARSGMSP